MYSPTVSTHDFQDKCSLVADKRKEEYMYNLTIL